MDEEAERRKAAVAKMRKENTTFPTKMNVVDLTSMYSYKRGRKNKDHDGVEVLPGSVPAVAVKYPFFVDYFYFGLVPPFSEMFNEVMQTYGFRLLDSTPNAVTCMFVFAHMCENFVGLVPNVPLFCHFYARIEGDALSGSVTCIYRSRMKEHYL